MSKRSMVTNSTGDCPGPYGTIHVVYDRDWTWWFTAGVQVLLVLVLLALLAILIHGKFAGRRSGSS